MALLLVDLVGAALAADGQRQARETDSRQQRQQHQGRVIAGLGNHCRYINRDFHSIRYSESGLIAGCAGIGAGHNAMVGLLLIALESVRSACV